MNKAKAFIATTLAVLSFSASAAVVSFVPTEDGLIATNTVTKSGAFTDFIALDLSKPSQLDAFVTTTNTFKIVGKKTVETGFFSKFDVALQKQDANGNFVTLKSFAANSGFEVEPFARGVYQFVVSGVKGGNGAPSWSLSANVAPVPEPETYALMGMGLVGLLAARRRKAQQAA